MRSYEKFQAVVLVTLVIGSIFGGVVAFSGTAAAANTSQLDFSGIYNADTVRGTADSGGGDFDNGGYSLVSSSYAQGNGNPASDGVPDDGVFPAVSNVHPRFDLADFNTDDSNAWQTTGTDSVTASVTSGQYKTVHVVASAGGSGPSSPAKFKLKLHYADGSTVTSSVFTVPDWYGSPPGDPGYVVRDGMDRYGGTYEDANEPGIWGYAVAADSSKTLTQVTIDVTENQAGAFDFFGGAATTQTSSVVSNGAPTASDDSASTNEDTTVTVDVVANDNDPDGDSLDVSSITNGPSHGTAQITGASNDEIEFVPGTDQTSDVSITYEVSDGNGGTDTATLSITVNPVNDAPTASDDTGTTDEDTPLSISDGDSSDLLELASDPEGDSLSLSAVDGTSFSSGTPVTLASGARITVNADGGWTYDPNGQFERLDDGMTDTDSFTYTVDDGNGGTDQGTITLTITGVTDPSSYEPPDDTPPTADAGPDRSITVGASITLDASNSTDDEELGTIQWDIDDDGGYERTGWTTALSFDSPGEYAVTLRVWDESSNSDTDTVRVTVSPPATATPETPQTTVTPVQTTAASAVTTPAVPDRDVQPTESARQSEPTDEKADGSAETPDRSSPTVDTAAETDTNSGVTEGTGTEGAEQTATSGPGFGAVAALLSLLALALGVGQRGNGN